MTEIKNKENLNIAYKILVSPWITEAASLLAEANKFVFQVFSRATKPQIKEAIEVLYKVKVLSVRIINIPSKKRMRGRVEGRKPGIKKAIVTLKKGDTINIYEGK